MSAGRTVHVEKRGDLAAARSALTGRVAVVMTMGALHEGHAELVRQARRVADRVAERVEAARADGVSEVALYVHVDLDVLDPQFPIIAGCVTPSHAFVRIEAIGCDVDILGMQVANGDLIHADRHGAVVIPAQHIEKMPAAIDIVVRTHSDQEQVMFEQLGVSKALMGERELAFAMAYHSLRSLGVEDDQADDIVEGLRGGGRMPTREFSALMPTAPRM